MAYITVTYAANGMFWSIADTAIRHLAEIRRQPASAGWGEVSFEFNGIMHQVTPESTLQTLWQSHTEQLNHLRIAEAALLTARS